MIGGILYQAFPMWLSVPLPWGGYAMDADIEISLSVHLILYILFLSQIPRLRMRVRIKPGGFVHSFDEIVCHICIGISFV